MKVKDLYIIVNRKKIKNLHLSIMPASGWIRISAPIEVDDEAIKLFVISKYAWIREKQKEFEEQLRESKREYVSGESHYLFGNRYVLKVEKTNKFNIKIKGKNIIYSVKSNSTLEQKEKYFEEWYRKLLRKQLSIFIDKWTKTLNVFPSSWTIRKMLTKWGSCNHDKKTLLFNLSLAKKPLDSIEYIVVHEMCHLVYKTHSKEFIELLTKLLPYWREIQKTLNDLPLDYYEFDQ